jgi:hypothetical protein
MYFFVRQIHQQHRSIKGMIPYEVFKEIKKNRNFKQNVKGNQKRASTASMLKVNSSGWNLRGLKARL